MVPLAMPLLQLIARLRSVPRADPVALRERMAGALRSFQERALAAGHQTEVVRRAHYALCVWSDDAVAQTPWGAPADPAGSMVSRFYPTVGPGRLDDVLRQLVDKAGQMRAALEVVALGASLAPPRDGGEDQRQRVLAALQQVEPAPSALSETWRGVDAPYRQSRTRLPLWVAAAAGAAVAGAVFLLLQMRVNAEGDALFARMLAAPPASMPRLEREAVPLPPPAPLPPTEPTAADRLRARLSALPAVSVDGTAAVPVVRIANAALFDATGARLRPGADKLLAAVADALRPEQGRLLVLGFVDNQPVRNVAFGSAFKLSAARAEAVRTALGRSLGKATPIEAQGRADANLLAPNDTAEGRARNSRIEIVLEGAPA